MKPVTIGYITSRVDCKVEWLCDSLAKWAADDLDSIQVVFVDRHLWALSQEAGSRYFRRGDLVSLTDERWMVESRLEKFERAVDGRFDFIHLPPKPNVHSGPFRYTPFDWWTAAQSRNTAVIAAKHPYYIGVDDLSVLLPSWWSNARHGAESGHMVAGAYKKVRNLVVEEGEIKSFTEYPEGVDSRWHHGSPNGIIPWHGSAVYGCSFGMPLETILQCNGTDELTDGQSAEDYDMAIRAERTGAPWYFNLNLTTFESAEAHEIEPSMPREKRVVPKELLPADYPPDGNPDSDHVILWLLRTQKRITTLGQFTNLRHARAEFQASQRAMIPTGPTHDWRTGQPLSQLTKLG